MGKSCDVATAVVEKSVVGKKLKIKVLAKKPANEVSDILQQVDGWIPNTSANQKVYFAMGKQPVNGSFQLSKVRCLENSSLTGNRMSTARDNENSIIGTKRGSESLSDCPERKRLKMDCIAASRCQSVLLKLMKHKFAIPFLHPVNPADWGIHDYFDIIKHPMDLGTIKQKLQRNLYTSAEDFEADVRLTFSNAMLYNPSNNWVHQHAKRLGEMFDSDWKSVKAMLLRENKHNSRKQVEGGVDKVTNDMRGRCLEGRLLNGDGASTKTMLQRENGSEDVKEMTLKVRWSNLQGVNDHEPRDKQLRANPNYAEPASRPDKESACHKPTKATQGNSNSVVEPASRPDKESACHKPTKATQGNSNSVKVPDGLNAVEVINTSTVQMARSDQDSDGAVSCLDEEHAGASVPNPAGSLNSIKESLESVLDIELSPSKALRAAKLRSRFADTILKAQNKTLLQPGGRKEAAILKQEKERLVRKQHEERVRIEAQVRAAELAARTKAEDELRKQRQQARDAARAALEKMERSINLDDNFHTFRDLETLIGSSSFIVCHDSGSRRVWNQFGSNELGSPLERLGLYIKAEYRVGDDDDEVLLPETDLEEGEVPS